LYDTESLLQMPTGLSDGCRLLFKAHNVFVKTKTTGWPMLVLEAVKAEQAKRKVA
jgi:hypothetical protein